MSVSMNIHNATKVLICDDDNRTFDGRDGNTKRLYIKDKYNETLLEITLFNDGYITVHDCDRLGEER